MPKHIDPKSHADAPVQRPVTDEEMPLEKQPSRLQRILTRIGLTVLLILALVLAYIFLLLGEPDEDAKYMSEQPEAAITMPMSPLEVPGEGDVSFMADTFDAPVLSLYHGLTMQKARIYDTAFEGGYARRVTLTYAFEDGQLLTVESIRPTAAVTLLQTAGAKLDATSLYTLGGTNAARMDNGQNACVFGQSDTAVYAVTCPLSHADELADLLRATVMIAPESSEN